MISTFIEMQKTASRYQFHVHFSYRRIFFTQKVNIQMVIGPYMAPTIGYESPMNVKILLNGLNISLDLL